MYLFGITGSRNGLGEDLKRLKNRDIRFLQEEKIKRELWETMMATFMNNVQLLVENVHVRQVKHCRVSVWKEGETIIRAGHFRYFLIFFQ